MRADFAGIALTELALAYAAEAKLAREEARGAGNNADLWGWSAAVERYAGQMPLLLDDIELGMPVELIVDGEKSLAVAVAQRLVILNHPRPSQQALFERQVLQEFCSRYHCGSIAPGGGEPEPIPVSRGPIKPAWNFSQQRWTCSHRGISIRFRNEPDLSSARVICEQLIGEASSLADELVWQAGLVVAIDWDNLAIQSAPRRPEHVIRLNASGDTVVLTVPLLYGTPGLLEQIMPWIKQRVTTQVDAKLEIDADAYGWQAVD